MRAARRQDAVIEGDPVGIDPGNVPGAHDIPDPPEPGRLGPVTRAHRYMPGRPVGSIRMSAPAASSRSHSCGRLGASVQTRMISSFSE